MALDLGDQLLGAARVLRDTVAPAVTDPYAADVLRGVVATVEALAAGVDAIEPFLRWDIEGTVAVLRSAGIEPPTEPLPVAAHHRAVRATLEASIPQIRDHPDAAAALAAHFRERIGRYPIVTQYRR